jgi:hypothetical protein
MSLPFMDKMNLLLKDKPVVKLEHVTEVLSGDMKESTVNRRYENFKLWISPDF